MTSIDISYNPYRLVTKLSIDGMDIFDMGEESYPDIRQFITQKIPLQTWIDPIPYQNWGGLLNAIADPERNGSIKICFSGRKIDFEDLKRALEHQNGQRKRDLQLQLNFQHNKKVLDDHVLAANIDEIVKNLESPRFKKLIDQRTSKELQENYEALDKNYKLALDSEFPIVIAGPYSSGKSTLLNVLMRHEILPTSDLTCTARNCRIRHDKTLSPNQILLAVYNKDGACVEKQLFEDDRSCADTFRKIQPDASNKKSSDSDQVKNDVAIELRVNLSHLYPDKKTEQRFTIVLIDTPGMTSVVSFQNGKNLHSEVAMNAINASNKPMVVFCLEAKRYQDQNIGELMSAIINASAAESGAFNDRFLFLMNMSDDITYDSDENAELNTADAVKNNFAEYLCTPEKWDSKYKNDEELINSSRCFTPRVFMTSALSAEAFLEKLYDIDEDEDLEDLSEKQQRMYNTLKNFRRRLLSSKRSAQERANYQLSMHCDIPEYRRLEIQKKFESALISSDKNKAAWYQTGIISVESAIQDYVARYAYPIKVRSLLETFDDMLEDVKAFSDSTLAELEIRKNELGEKKGERKGVSARKKLAEEKQSALKNAKNQCAGQLQKIQELHFDSDELRKAATSFRAKINGDPDVKEIQDSIRCSNGKISTGQKSEAEVSKILDEKNQRIKKTFTSALENINQKISVLNGRYEQNLWEIIGVVQQVVSDLQGSGVLQYGTYNFRKNMVWKKVSQLDYNLLQSEMKKEVTAKSIKSKKRKNRKKKEYQNSLNPFKWIAAFFMDDYTYDLVPVAGYYDVQGVYRLITEWQDQIVKESKAMEQTAMQNLETVKSYVNDLITSLMSELDAYQADIQTTQQQLDSIGDDINCLNQTVEEYQNTCNWLKDLSSKMEGE